MKGSSDSSSSSKLTWVLVQAKKLFWHSDGTTNLPEWKVDVVQATKGAYGIYSVCLVKLKIPDEWIDEFPMPTEREWDAMIDPEKRVFDIRLSKYENVRQGWELSITGNASRNIPNTMCGLVGTFLLSTKMFLIPCVLWAISGTISNIFLIPNNIRNNLFVPDIMWNHFTMFLIWRCLFSLYDNLLVI